MGQRAIGGGVVILVLIGVLIGSVLLGPDEPGSAVRAAPPQPPAIGTCIDGFLDPVPVPCDQPHTGEISLSWTGDALPDASALDDIAESLPYPVEDAAGDPQLLCWMASVAYLGTAPAADAAPSGFAWTRPGPGASSDLIQGPANSRVPDWSWSACLFSPSTPGSDSSREYSISARGVLADESLPRDPGWRQCANGPDLWAGLTSCLSPHRFEIVASGNRTVPELPAPVQVWADHDDPAAVDECTGLADAYLGVPVDSHAGDLRVSVLLADAVPVNDEQGARTTSLTLLCVLGVDADRTLTGSIADLGAAPLPLD